MKNNSRSSNRSDSTLFNHTIHSTFQHKYKDKKLPKSLGTTMNWDFPCTIARDIKSITIEHPNYNSLDILDHQKLKNNSIDVLLTLQSFLEEDEANDETDLDCFSILDELEEASTIGSPNYSPTKSQKISNKYTAAKPSKSNANSFQVLLQKKNTITSSKKK